jgi:hypothetical protein
MSSAALPRFLIQNLRISDDYPSTKKRERNKVFEE